MPHKLILTKGSAVKFVGNASMNHMGSLGESRLQESGTYRFTTEPGEDYKGIAMRTIGEDNVLHLTVTVS
jgi:hypothetical protein